MYKPTKYEGIVYTDKVGYCTVCGRPTKRVGIWTIPTYVCRKCDFKFWEDITKSCNSVYGVVCQIENLSPIFDSTNLVETIIYEDSVLVDSSVKIGDIGIYFPAGVQLSKEFCDNNSYILRGSSGYIDKKKRNVKRIRIRGKKSEGLWMPISSISYIGADKIPNIGEQVEVIDGHAICQTYEP